MKPKQQGFIQAFGEAEPFVVCQPCFEGMSNPVRLCLVMGGAFLELLRECFAPVQKSKLPDFEYEIAEGIPEGTSVSDFYAMRAQQRANKGDVDE